MKRTGIIIIGVWLLYSSCTQNIKDKAVSKTYNAKVYKTENKQYGYDIYKDTARIIHQPIIPGVAGNAGFKTESDASKVADLMIGKLDNNIMPPSITLHELDSLKIALNDK